MRQLRAWCLRFAALFRKEQQDRELAEELESHLQMHIEDNLRSGMNPAEARRQALIKLGGVEQTKENYRDRRGIQWFETLLQDLRFGLRMLQKNPGFTAVALLALSLGIGANTAIFSVVSAILLRPLPYKDSDRLVVVWSNKLSKGMRQQRVSALDFKDFVAQQQVFDEMGAIRAQPSVLTGGQLPERVESASVSPSIFKLLGANATLGRTFDSQEDQPGKDHVAVLSDGLWRRRFGADPNILGRALVLDGKSYTVIGVTR